MGIGHNKKEVVNEAMTHYKEKNMTMFQLFCFIYDISHHIGFVYGMNVAIRKKLSTDDAKKMSLMLPQEKREFLKKKHSIDTYTEV